MTPPLTVAGDPLPATGVHRAHQLPGVSDPLPLCWIAEVRERLGGDDGEHAEAWQVSIDHEAVDLEQIRQSDNPAGVTCLPCRAQMNA